MPALETAGCGVLHRAEGATFNDLGPTAHFDYANSTHVNDGNTVQTRLLTQVTETASHQNGTYEESKPTSSTSLNDTDKVLAGPRSEEWRRHDLGVGAAAIRVAVAGARDTAASPTADAR